MEGEGHQGGFFNPDGEVRPGLPDPGTWEFSGPWSSGGCGSVGSVLSEGRKVAAIKRFNQVAAWAEEEARFEFDALSDLDGAGGHAPRVFARGHYVPDDGNRAPAIVMEYVGGKTLYDMMVGFDLSGGDDRSPGTDGADALRSIGAVAEAVRSCYEAAPARGVHRDLSPNNVMVRREGGAVTHAVLVDFGQGAQPGVVTPGRKGTPQYAAPEMFGGKYYTHKYRDAPTVDVWSLGALAYLVRTGKDPFRDEVVGGNPGGEDGGMVADFKRDHPIVLPDSLLLTDEDRRLSELISRCTEYDPRRRFQSAGEVLAFVEEALGTRPAPCVTPAMPHVAPYVTPAMPHVAPYVTPAMPQDADALNVYAVVF